MKSDGRLRAGAVVLGSVAALAFGPGASNAQAETAPVPADVHGLAVMAAAGAESSAWSLAQGVYADPSLRPSFDEAHARVLAGDAAPADAPADVRDLAETRAAVHGDDPASKRLLASIATQLHVRGIVYVEDGPAPALPHARVFVTSASAFDAATYAATTSPANGNNANNGSAPAASNVAWADTVRLLARSYGTTIAAPVVTPVVTPTPALATTDVPTRQDRKDAKDGKDSAPTHHPFYTSPWFWGAVGAAVFGGVAIYFATKNSDSDTVHLQLQVPK